MMIDILGTSKGFFSSNLSDNARSGMLAIINSCGINGIIMKTQVAYVLATAYHESAGRMRGIDEIGHGEGHPYGIPDDVTGKIYYGRGIVQLTWKSNYQLFTEKLAIDLVNNPELANRLDIAVRIIVLGMKYGLFTSRHPGLDTGVNLGRFIVDGSADFVGARKIINGTDCAEKIADYAVRFTQLLS